MIKKIDKSEYYDTVSWVDNIENKINAIIQVVNDLTVVVNKLRDKE